MVSVGAVLGGGWRPDPVQDALPGGKGEQAPDLGWICERYRNQAVGYAFTILRDHATAEDAVQLALARIVARVAAGDRALLDGDPERVVIRNTRWAALDLVQRRRSNEDLEPAEQCAEVMELSGRIWERSQARQLCDQIAADLPIHYRDALRMRFVEQHPDADAASRLGITLKAYRCRLDRALREARQAATRLGIDSLGGLVVVGWRAVVRRSTCLRAAAQASGANLNIILQPAIHGVLALVLAGGLIVLPLLAGGSSQGAGGPGRLLAAGRDSGPTGEVQAAYAPGPPGALAGCGNCDWLPAAPALTGGAVPLPLTSTGSAAIQTSTSQVGALVGSSQTEVPSAAADALDAGVGDATSAASTASAAVRPAGGLATVPSVSAPSLPVATPSLP